MMVCVGFSIIGYRAIRGVKTVPNNLTSIVNFNKMLFIILTAGSFACQTYHDIIRCQYRFITVACPLLFIARRYYWIDLYSFIRILLHGNVFSLRSIEM